MATLIDYPLVLETLRSAGLRCVYHNSGSFGILQGVTSHVLGWVGPEDPTIRPEVRALIRRIEPPYERTLAGLLGQAWQSHLPGPMWLMPASHWAYELQFGSAGWMPELLQSVGIRVEALRDRSDGSAIEFSEGEEMCGLIEKLFEHMGASDFTVAFPGKPIAAILHHHKQIWWQTSDNALHDALMKLAV